MLRDALPQCARSPGVLVADDEAGVRDVLGEGLRQEGFAVWLAADGREALDVFRQRWGSIDVVLLDVCMPDLDGPQTLAAIQELIPRIPCCFMTGWLGSYTEQELRHRGADAVFQKPFRLSEVAPVLRAVARPSTCTGPPAGPRATACLPPRPLAATIKIDPTRDRL